MYFVRCFTIVSNHSSKIPELFNIPVKFTFFLEQPNTKTVIALAVFIQLQEAMEAKVIYLQTDVKAK